jgi:hypothetical protein
MVAKFQKVFGLCAIILGCAVVLSACAPLYPVQIAPIGNGQYIAVQASASAWIDARAAAIQRAGRFCNKMHRQIVVLDSAQQRASAAMMSNDHASVTFRCQ